VRALVTGGAGFIGSNLVDALLAQGHEVSVLDDLSTGSRANVAPDADLIEASVTDAERVGQAMEGVEVVFHQAAARAVLQSVEHPLQTDHVNTHGTLTVLACARRAGVRRVVFASSSSVYGGATMLPTPETAPATPRSPYGVSKLAGEHYCRVATELYGVETVSLRYFNVYGMRQRADSAYAAVVPTFIGALLRRSAPTVHGDGEQSRDFTFIDDVVAANLAAAEAPGCSGRVYNIAGGAAYTVLHLLKTLQAITGVFMEPVHTEPRPGDVRHSCADIRSARDDLGYLPSVSLEQGLQRTVDWLASPRV
jgi:UDP-glucose 4-epimerase